MSTFRKLMAIALMADALSGLVWFGLQYVAVIPLIETAEKYESAAGHHEGDDANDGSRLNRNAVTAVTTILTGIGFAALLFGVASLAGQRLDVRSGALWGLAGFACVSLGPSFGLPPQPPGSAVADLTSRQIWWTATVIATAVGIYCIARYGRRRMMLVAGIACLLLPHLVGAPVASGQSVVPASLIRQFEIRSLSVSGVFWVTLGRYSELGAHTIFVAPALGSATTATVSSNKFVSTWPRFCPDDGAIHQKQTETAERGQ